MRKLKRWLRNWLNDNRVEVNYDGPVAKNSTRSPGMETSAVNLGIYYGSGGIAVETRYYDRKTDSHATSLYIIPDGKDLGEEIGKIVSLEMLKR